MQKLFILFLFVGLQVQAQDTTSIQSYVDIPVEPTSNDQMATGLVDSPVVEPLLSHKMLFTQRVFWGPNGLLRAMNVAPLTAEGREKELKVRRFMLISHQVTGYVTLAGFLMQGILEARLNKATGATYDQLYKAQQTTLAITNIAYGTTALLSLTAPPKQFSDRKASGGGLKLHKYLAIIHLTGFVATNILAGKVTQHSELRPYRQAATFTTLAAFAPALIALKF